MKVPAILKNKYVCWALMALAGLNIVGYVTVKAWECLALFLLTAYSANCYCKNMGCAILAALFVANFVFGCGRVTEGFKEASDPLGKAKNLVEGEKEKKEGEGDAPAAAALDQASDAVAAAKEECEGPDCPKE